MTPAYDSETGKPWSTLGTSVKGATTAADALKIAGLDWTVSKSPLWSRFGSKYVKITDRWGMQRDSDGRVLGTVGSDYVPFQNTEAFAFLDTPLAKGDAAADAAGSLFNGKRVWMTAQLEDFAVLGDSVYKQFLLITNSHDGSRALQASITPIRDSAGSTEARALASAPQTWRIRHRGDLAGKVEEADETMQLAQKYTNAFKDQAEALAKVHVSADAFEAVLRRSFPDQKRQLAANLQSVKVIRYESPRIPDDLRGTAYGALSALTEWTSWGKDYRTDEARLKSLLFGWAQQVVTRVAADLLEI